jgi:putative regulator of septum formation
MMACEMDPTLDTPPRTRANPTEPRQVTAPREPLDGSAAIGHGVDAPTEVLTDDEPRTAVADDSPTDDRHPAGQPSGSATRPAKANRMQLGLVLGLMIGAIAMFASAALTQTTDTVVPVLSGLAAAPLPPNERPIAQRPAPPSTPGTCLSWRRDDAADAQAVDCAAAHLFEQAGTLTLTQFGPDAPFPDNKSFRQLVNDQCTKVVSDYLNGKYDPDGAFRAGALKPSSKAWFNGDRSLRCGLQRFSRSGALYPIVGKVANQDQSDIRPAGTCLGIDDKFIGDPVSCSRPHAVESVGAIDLGQKFSKYPQVGDQDSYLQPQCAKLATDFAGGDQVLAQKNLSVMWDNLSQESWNAGTRKVACNLAATLPDRSGFAAIVGEVKGQITVANQPAAPAQPTAQPGAPAGDDKDNTPAQGPDNNTTPDNGGGEVDAQPKPVLPEPSELNNPPKLPQLPNPFAPKDGDASTDNKPQENPLGRLFGSSPK